MEVNEMVEKVARAIYEGGRWRVRGLGQPVAAAWEDISEEYRRTWLTAARNGIEAMRYPTDAMMDGFMSCNAEPAEPHDEHRHWSGDFGQFAGSFSAMIDAALSSGEQDG